MPCLAAKPRVDQCVESDGADSSVSITTASTTSSPMAGRPWPRRIGQPAEPVGGEAMPPLRHRRRMHPQLRGDVGVRSTGRGGQHDPAAQRQRLRRAVPAAPALQRGASSALKVISTVGRPRLAMLSLRCWSTTPDERGPAARFPITEDSSTDLPSRTRGLGLGKVQGAGTTREPLLVVDQELLGQQLPEGLAPIVAEQPRRLVGEQALHLHVVGVDEFDDEPAPERRTAWSRSCPPGRSPRRRRRHPLRRARGHATTPRPRRSARRTPGANQ
jgi:hypothetical protein